jgi:hypothetical protein
MVEKIKNLTDLNDAKPLVGYFAKIKKNNKDKFKINSQIIILNSYPDIK